MKLKFLPMFAGVITTAAIASTTLAAFAQAPPASAPQTRPRIVLSQEQQAKFEGIKNNTVRAIEEILNAQQKAQFAEGRKTGEGLGAVQNLSDSQKTKIMSILQAFNSQIGDILTAEQKQQIEQSQQSQSRPSSPSSQPKW